MRSFPLRLRYLHHIHEMGAQDAAFFIQRNAGTHLHDLALAHLGLSNSVINIPGCPMHPDWLVGTLVSVLTGQPVPLDSHN